MGEAEGRKEAHEAGRADRSAARSFSGAIENQGLNHEHEKEEPKRKSVVREYAEAIVIAVVLALFIRTFIVQAFKIPSGSMKQTLYVGDHILVNKFLYGIRLPFLDVRLFPFRDPRQLDVVVFKFPEDETKDFIKRIIGLPGDTIEIKEKVVFQNGKPLTERYTIYTQPSADLSGIEPRDNFGPVVVPEDSYFVMGDNRDQSLDSRFWGFVKVNKIEGKAFMIYWSVDKGADWLGWIRWGRVGRLIS